MIDGHEKYQRWTHDELKALDRWDWERTNLYSFKAKAESMGISIHCLEAAVWRARSLFREKPKEEAEVAL